MKWIADEQSRLKPSHLKHAGYRAHGLAGRTPCVFHQNRTVRNAALPGVVSSHGGFAGGIPGSCATCEYQKRR